MIRPWIATGSGIAGKPEYPLLQCRGLFTVTRLIHALPGTQGRAIVRNPAKWLADISSRTKSSKKVYSEMDGRLRLPRREMVLFSDECMVGMARRKSLGAIIDT